MTRWRLVGPDGDETVVEGDLADACEQHEMVACLVAGCPDAFGWVLTDLDTGTVTVPEVVEARIAAALAARLRDGSPSG